jgi:hypothetical protein
MKSSLWRDRAELDLWPSFPRTLSATCEARKAAGAGAAQSKGFGQKNMSGREM